MRLLFLCTREVPASLSGRSNSYNGRMDITDDEVQDYKCLHEQEFHEIISDTQAREIIGRIFLLYDLLCQPLPSEMSGKHITPARGKPGDSQTS